ncbi:MAG: hypothetical protein HQM08_02180 [Candidatus Riflebacteria bacterium]|nr:hypothetical protein [Candidatus Riflebacteria bacterium]
MLKYLSIGLILLALFLLPAAITGCGEDDLSMARNYSTVGPGNADAGYLLQHPPSIASGSQSSSCSLR